MDWLSDEVAYVEKIELAGRAKVGRHKNEIGLFFGANDVIGNEST